MYQAGKFSIHGWTQRFIRVVVSIEWMPGNIDRTGKMEKKKRLVRKPWVAYFFSQNPAIGILQKSFRQANFWEVYGEKLIHSPPWNRGRTVRWAMAITTGGDNLPYPPQNSHGCCGGEGEGSFVGLTVFQVNGEMVNGKRKVYSPFPTSGVSTTGPFGTLTNKSA